VITREKWIYTLRLALAQITAVALIITFVKGLNGMALAEDTMKVSKIKVR